MKDGAIVPDIVEIRPENRLCDIGLAPADRFRTLSETPLCDLKSRLRDVGNCDIPVLAFKQVVNQCRCATSYINDRRGPIIPRGTFN
jgi:hypothetical protein